MHAQTLWAETQFISWQKLHRPSSRTHLRVLMWKVKAIRLCEPPHIPPLPVVQLESQVSSTALSRWRQVLHAAELITICIQMLMCHFCSSIDKKYFFFNYFISLQHLPRQISNPSLCVTAGATLHQSVLLTQSKIPVMIRAVTCDTKSISYWYWSH